MPLRNKDRIQVVIAARKDPHFSGALVDVIRNVRTKIAERLYSTVKPDDYFLPSDVREKGVAFILNKSRFDSDSSIFIFSYFKPASKALTVFLKSVM